jgi:hypothetical protein
LVFLFDDALQKSTPKEGAATSFATSINAETGTSFGSITNDVAENLVVPGLGVPAGVVTSILMALD